MAFKINSSFSCVSAYLSSPIQRNGKQLKLSSRQGLFRRQPFDIESVSSIKVVKPCQLVHGKLTLKQTLSKRCNLLAASEDQETVSDLEGDDFEQEGQGSTPDDSGSSDISFDHIERAVGKPGFISFHGLMRRREDEVIVAGPVEDQNNLMWLVGPTALVASFIFPSLYLRRILSSIFEDSLLTDFLILFFTEAIFYCGVAVFLFLIDRLRRPKEPTYAETSQILVPHFGDRISSVAVLVLSLIIPTVTMGFVWPWTGPAASATLAPYLVGIIVQFTFEQYARYVGSPSWPTIPIIFQVYRLHQLNRAAQLVTALSFTVKGAEMTPHNLAINGSLSTLLNVLQFLGVICIWSLSSFIMRYFHVPTLSRKTEGS
ncbi:transmembrane protein [Perilla frutescens var. frutescens]|nr:transmembrane protein [Perilla frutescens var. frutescens]